MSDELSEIPTPRTDAVWDEFSKGGHIDHGTVFRFARQLERELSALKIERMEWEANAIEAGKAIGIQETELASLRAKVKVARDALLKAQRKHRSQFASTTAQLTTIETPYDTALAQLEERG